jgi:hypothetical protein
MLIRVSNPPHRDLPIEWRTDTGEFISQPARGQAPVGPPLDDPPPSGQPRYGQPLYSSPLYEQPPGQTPSGWTPAGEQPTLPASSAADTAAAPASAAPAPADEFFEIHPADHAERRTAVRLRLVVLVLALIGLGAVWATGGLAKDASYHPDDGIQTVAVGETVDTGPFRMSVDAAAVFDEYGKLRPFGDDNGSILVIKLTMENLTDVSIGTSLYAVSIEGFTGLSKPDSIQTVLERDGSAAHYLHPGLPERVVYAWELNPGADPPTEVKVILHGATWRNFIGFAFMNEPQWLDHGPRAEVSVPVEDRRAGQ